MKIYMNGDLKEKGQILDVGGGCNCVDRGDWKVCGGREPGHSTPSTEAISRDWQRAPSLA